MIKKYKLQFTQELEIEIDDEKLTEEFMDEFKEYFYDFDTIEEHVEHIGQIYARSAYSTKDGKPFIEGYGTLDCLGVKIKEGDYCCESEEQEE